MHKDIKALAADNQRLNDTLIAKENEISFLISKNEKLELHLKTLEQIEVAFKEATSKLDSKTVELNSLKASLSNEKKKRSLDDDEKKKLDSLEQDFKKMRNKAEIAVKEAEQFKL
jgi:small-conductance mechanosensitive channel